MTLADRKSLQPAPVYRYRDDYQSNFPIKGTDWTLRAGHASDISVVFDNYEISDLQGNGPGLAAAAKAMSSYFASFARSGVPTAEGQPAWPRYDTREARDDAAQQRMPRGERSDRARNASSGSRSAGGDSPLSPPRRAKPSLRSLRSFRPLRQPVGDGLRRHVAGVFQRGDVVRD